MHIGFDVSSLDTPHLSGVGIYITQLFNELKRVKDVDCYPVVRWSRFKKASQIKNHIRQTPHPTLAGKRLFNFQHLDLWHGPDFRIPASGRIPKVVTIHDLAFYDAGLTSSEFAEKRIQLLERTIRQKPNAIITVSEHTKSCLLSRFPDLKTPVFAIHLGADHLSTANPQATRGEASVAPKPYFLFVGNLEARKNIKGLLLAFDKFCESHPQFELVLIGRPGYGYEEVQQTLDKMRYKKNVILLGYLSSKDLKKYYQHATAFVYPSLHEGFGIPLLEAMGMGCPVLTADRTATKEVAQNAAHLVNPEDIEAIAQGMTDLLDKDFRDKLIDAGLARFKDFAWSSTAHRTAAVYTSVLSSSFSSTLEQSQSLKNF